MTTARHLSGTFQPPSGGCVLKPQPVSLLIQAVKPAAFGRLCVETLTAKRKEAKLQTSRLRAAVC